MLLKLLVSFGLALYGHKFLGTCGTQDGSSALYDIADVFSCKLLDFSSHQAVISTVDAFNFKSVADSTARDCADGCVHARSVTS